MMVLLRRKTLSFQLLEHVVLPFVRVRIVASHRSLLQEVAILLLPLLLVVSSPVLCSPVRRLVPRILVIGVEGPHGLREGSVSAAEHSLSSVVVLELAELAAPALELIVLLLLLLPDYALAEHCLPLLVGNLFLVASRRDMGSATLVGFFVVGLGGITSTAFFVRVALLRGIALLNHYLPPVVVLLGENVIPHFSLETESSAAKLAELGLGRQRFVLLRQHLRHSIY